MDDENVEFATVTQSPHVSLSLRLYKPPASLPSKQDPTIVLVHPYSVFRGCQDLLKGLASNLASRGYLCVTFDMRGVQKSTGKASWTGVSEVQDVVAVCAWAVENIPTSKILLVGSSAGAPIAGSAVDQAEGVVGYVALGYPFGRLASILFGRHNKAILESSKPKLFVMGTRDGFTSVKQLKNKVKAASGRVETHLVPGAGHVQIEGPLFEAAMSDLIANFAKTL